jgi:hypothetical protein
MSFQGRLKSIAGGGTIPTLTAASTLRIPDESTVYLLSGTATVTSLEATRSWPGQHLRLIGTSGVTTLTNTTGTTTAGQMDLGGANIEIAAKDIVNLIRMNDGTWRLAEARANNAVSVEIASAATLTVPSTSDVFTLTGTETITSITVVDNDRYRELTFIGAASSGVTFTHTTSPSAGQMNLRGDNRYVGEDGVLVLIVKPDNTLLLKSFTGN